MLAINEQVKSHFAGKGKNKYIDKTNISHQQERSQAG